MLLKCNLMSQTKSKVQKCVLKIENNNKSNKKKKICYAMLCVCVCLSICKDHRKHLFLG